MPQKQKTLKHYNLPGHAHFLTFFCFRRIPLLGKDRTRNWFLEALERARQVHQFDLWAWVIMPDHAHLLIHPRLPEYDIALILRSIKQPVGTKATAFLKDHSPAFLQRLLVMNKHRRYYRFWQPGAGFDRNQVEPRAIHTSIDYLHNNPVRAGLVPLATDSPYSSVRDWADWPDVLIRVDRTVPIWHPIG